MRIALFIVLCLLVLSRSAATGQLDSFSPQISYINQDHVITASPVQDNKSGLVLQTAKLNGGEIRAIPVSDSHFLSWQLTSNYLWLTSGNFPIGPLRYDTYHRIHLDPLIKHGTIQPNPSTIRDKNTALTPTNSCVQYAIPLLKLAMVVGNLEFPFKAYYDYRPLSPKSVRLYILTNTDVVLGSTDQKNPGKKTEARGDVRRPKWTFRSADYTLKDGPSTEQQADSIWLAGEWSAVTEHDVEFTEPFRAIPNGERSTYLLTQSGKLYMAHCRGVEERVVEEVWVDPKYPIKHVLVYPKDLLACFGDNSEEPGKPREGFYFAMNGGPRPKDYVLSSLKSFDADSPLREALQYADYFSMIQARLDVERALRADKRLKVRMQIPDDRFYEIDEVLAMLSEKSGITFTLDSTLKGHRPQFRNVEDEMYMLLGLLQVKGLTYARWNPIPGGYKLTAEEIVPDVRHDSIPEPDELDPTLPEVVIRSDSLLQAKLTVVQVNPTLSGLLAQLESATGLTFRPDSHLANHDPDFGDVQFRNVPAWTVMNLIAKTDLTNGHWEKVEGGYRLLADASLRQRIPDPSRDWFWIWVVSAIALAVVLAVLVGLYLGKKAKTQTPR